MKGQRSTECDVDKEDRMLSQISSESYYSQKYSSQKNDGDDSRSNDLNISSLSKSFGYQKFETNPPICKALSQTTTQGGIRNQQKMRKTEITNQSVGQANGKLGSSKTISPDIKIILHEAFKPYIDIDRVSQGYHQPFYVPSLENKQNPNRLHNGHIFKDHNMNIYDPTYEQCVAIGFIFVVIFIIFAIIPAGAIISIMEKSLDLGIFAIGIGGVILEFLWENLL